MLFWIIVFLIVYVLGIFFIGIPMGKKSLKTWKRWASASNFFKFIFFPMTFLDNYPNKEIKKTGPVVMMPFVDSVKDEEINYHYYIGTTALIWLLRILLNMFAVIFVYSWAYILPIAFKKFATLLGKTSKTPEI